MQPFADDFDLDPQTARLNAAVDTGDQLESAQLSVHPAGIQGTWYASEWLLTSELPMHPNEARVLVADDDRDTADTTADLLRLAGYHVQAVYDGLEAVKAAQLLQPHVVVLDINMPAMDGFAAAREIRRLLGTQVALISHTAQTGVAAHGQAARAGFDHQLLKPVDSSRLLAIVADAIGKRQSVN